MSGGYVDGGLNTERRLGHVSRSERRRGGKRCVPGALTNKRNGLARNVAVRELLLLLLLLLVPFPLLTRTAWPTC